MLCEKPQVAAAMSAVAGDGDINSSLSGSKVLSISDLNFSSGSNISRRALEREHTIKPMAASPSGTLGKSSLGGILFHSDLAALSNPESSEARISELEAALRAAMDDKSKQAEEQDQVSLSVSVIR